MQILLNSSFHISSWCVQVIWLLYLFDPLFFFLKETVLVLPIETYEGKLLEDNTWWASAAGVEVAEQRLWHRAVPHENLVARPFDMVSVRCCALPTLLWEMRELVCHFFLCWQATKKERIFSLSGKLPFPFDLLYGSTFPLWMKKMLGLLLGKAECNLETQQSLHTCHIPMNNTVLLSQRPHSAQISFLKTLLQSGRLLHLIERYETLIPGSDRSVIKSFKTNVVTPWGTFLWC